MAVKQGHYCERCQKTLDPVRFYKSNNTEKYPDRGLVNMCKECMTARVDNWDSSTYEWIFQELDVPYLPFKWDSIMAKYAAEPEKITKMTIVGKYLSAIKLKPFKDYRYKDSEFLCQMEEKKRVDAMKKQGYDAQQIAENLAQATELPPKPVETMQPQLAQPDYFAQMSGADEDSNEIVAELTDDDRKYLRIKWGHTYRPEEWVRLEQLYNDMCDSYDIQGAGHEDNLKLLCKTSLKSNQLLDLGDVEGAQKMLKMYDQLMKSGKFSAAQNKADDGNGIDSVSELVAICESEGFIPRYYTDGPKDKVDRVLQDLQEYTHSLIMDETNLGSLIEKAVKQIEEDKEKEANADFDSAEEEEAYEESLFSDGSKDLISDSDMQKFFEAEEDWENQAQEYFNKLEDEEDD